MKLHHLIQYRTAVVMACGAAFAAGVVAFNAKADEWDKKTVLTISTPVQVKDTLLEPGQYVFKLLRSDSDRHVVQIFNSDESHIINTIIAIPKERLEPTGHSVFTFYETPAGKARALRAWFYPGDNFGQEFPYPKHLRDVAVAHVTQTTTQAEAPPPPPPAQAMTEPPPPEPAPEPQAAETPAPEPEPAPAPMPDTEANRTQELPKTASPYPLIGLSGLSLLGLAGLLRLKREA
jgi:LPXTG-motif cell wall-anchored protein